MIKLFKEVDKKLVTISDNENIFNQIEEGMWIHMTNPSLDDVEKICNITKLNPSMLKLALDEEETAHIDIDDDDTLITLDVPYKLNDVYETVPFAMMYNNKYFVTLSIKEIALVDYIFQKFKTIEPHKHVRLSLQIMYRIASMYILSLKNIDSKRNLIEKSIKTASRNKEIYDLMELNKSLIYFSTSLNSNKVVLSKIKRLPEYKKYEADYDLIEDVEVENNQAIEMCSIHREILSGMMDVFSSIISNKLNDVMKVLAIITLIISIPTLIASLFGMNVIIPLKDNKYSFIIIIIISLLVSILGAIILFKLTGKNKKRD